MRGIVEVIRMIVWSGFMLLVGVIALSYVLGIGDMLFGWMIP